MKQECIQKVEAHLSAVRGKAVKLTAAEIAGIDRRMVQAMRDLNQRDTNAFRAMTQDERTAAAGIEAASSLERAADQAALGKLWQTRLRVQARDDLVNLANTPKAKGGTKTGLYRKYPHTAALVQMMEQTARQKGGAAAALHGQLGQLWDSLSKRFNRMPYMSSPEADGFMGFVFREMRGENTNSAEAKAVATGLTDILSEQRKRLNTYGANIGELKDYVPQDHNPLLIAKAGRDTWVNDVFGWVDKSDYLDANGNQRSDDEIRDVLRGMYDTLTTDGRAKREYNEQLAQIEQPLGGRSVMERAASFSRKINFRDAASHEAYHAAYSELKPQALLLQHMSRVAEDLAIVERFGPDAKQNILKLIDVAHRLDDNVPGAELQANKRTVAGLNATQLAESLLGHDNDFKSAVVDAARWFGSMHTATKLVRTAVRAVPQDLNTVINYAAELGHFYKLPQMLKAATNGATRRQLHAMGIGAQILEQSIMKSGRRVLSVGDAMGIKGMDRAAAETMHLSGLQAWTNTAGRVGQMLHGAHFAEVRALPFDQLEQGTKQLFAEVGIHEGNWDRVRLTPTTKVGGIELPDVGALGVLNLPAAEHNEVTRLVNAFLWEGGNKITNERDLLARTAMRMGALPGTNANALIQALFLFRGVVSVITANMKRRWSRQATPIGKVGVTSGYMFGATAAGYIGNGLINLADGKDLPDPTDHRTWMAAFGTGGGGGFLGEMIVGGLGEMSQTQGSANAWRLLGPTGSELGDVFDLGSAMYKAATSNDATPGKVGFKAIRIARNHIPLMNLWYTKTAIDHLFMNDMNEMVMPGYKRKMEGLAEKYGNQYWWKPSGQVDSPGFGKLKD